MKRPLGKLLNSTSVFYSILLRLRGKKYTKLVLPARLNIVTYLDGNKWLDNLEVIIISPGVLGLLHDGHGRDLQVAVLHQFADVLLGTHCDTDLFLYGNNGSN